MSDDDRLSDDTAAAIDAIPDVAEPLLGFRSWVWDRAHRLLTSVVQSGTPWPPGKDLHATCLRSKHLAADPACSCGIYATTDIGVAAPYTGVGNCFGLVYGWGKRCVPADNGFRCEYARLAAIFAVVREVSMERPHLARIANLYGVPLITPHSLEVEDYRLLLQEGAADMDAELRNLTGGNDEEPGDQGQPENVSR
jgi:hypothetical protein